MQKKPLKLRKGSKVPKGKEERKVSKVMKEYSKGDLHSGSKKGPVVKDKAQALAIGYSEAKQSGKNTKTPRKK